MRNKILLIGLLTLSMGCANLKQEVGDYVKDSLVDSIERKLDEKLAGRGLSVAEIKSVLDANRDGSIPSAEALQAIKALGKDYLSLEGQKLFNDQLAKFSDKVASKVDLQGANKDLWNSVVVSLGAIVSAYLGKQVFSAKNDGNRDARLAFLEKIVHRDLDGDGKIGEDAV